MMINEGQMVCVELVAKNSFLNGQRVLFLGSIKYEALKRVYEARVFEREVSMLNIYNEHFNLGNNKYSICSTYVLRDIYKTTSGICSNAWTERMSIHYKGQFRISS